MMRLLTWRLISFGWVLGNLPLVAVQGKLLGPEEFAGPDKQGVYASCKDAQQRQENISNKVAAYSM